jgi:hypothetical protein
MNVHNKNTNIKYKLNFKTMKKGLLTVLLASLVLVGCQNYDDQFDDLNAQISALKSQVDGLASLSGQVSSLSGSISGLQAGVAAAQAAATAAGASADAATAAANAIDLTGLSAGLTTLQAEVDAVQASLATAATASAVAALQTELDAIEADVDELLSTSNIYSTAVTVNSVATLDAALALGNKLNILNAAATITVSTAMDQAKVQTLVNRIKTMTGDLTFNSSSTTETTFENLTSVSGLYANQKGGYNFKNLISAAAVQLNDQYEANVSVIDFRSLTTVTSFATLTAAEASSANTIDFNQATELHLTSLARYPGSSLTIVTKEGATLAMPVLDDKDNNGLYEATALTMTGPASFSTSLLTDGTLAFTNVATVSVTDYRGGITINTGVETFTGTDIVALTVDTGADDLTSVTADFKRDDAANLTTAQTAALAYDQAAGNNGDLSLTGLANLTSATVSGDAGDITISTNPNLTTVTISANAFDLTMDDNDNMTSVTVTGAKFHDVSITGMADLTSLTLDHTTKLPEVSTTASADETGASMTVTGNASLTSLTASADDIDALTVNTNAALETLDFTGLADDGSSTVTTAAIYNNNLKVTLFKNSYDSTGTAYTTTDTGSITTTSGIDTLKTWLDAVMSAASATSGIYVYVDQIDKYEVQSTLNGAYTDTAVPSAPAVTTEATANSNSTSIYAIVAKQAAETTTTGSTVREAQTVVFPITSNSIQAPNTVLGSGHGININAAGLSKMWKAGDTNAGSTVSTVAELVSYIDGDTSWGSELTISASNEGYLKSNQTVNYTYGNGSAGSISLTGSAGNLWYNLGSGVVSGTIALVNSDAAQAVASKLANAISAATHPTTGAVLYNAVANGAVVEIMNAVSVATYPDDVTPWAADIPQITFNVTTASTTAFLGGTGGVSNVTGNELAGTTSGFFINTTKQDVEGLAITIVNNNKGITRLANAVVSIASNGTTSGIWGLGQSGTTSQTANSHGTTGTVDRQFSGAGTAVGNNTVSAMLVSNTHFYNGQSKTGKVAVFSLISDATTSTSQSAAITDRTGWL